MRLSANFTLGELTASGAADRLRLDNTPPPDALENLRRLCTLVLEPARLVLGVPLVIDSGYRSTAVNAAVGGQPGSQHRKGLAADIKPRGLDHLVAARMLQAAHKAGAVKFDQLILEFYRPGEPFSGWLHVSAGLPPPEKWRGQVLSYLKRPDGTVFVQVGLPGGAA